MITKKEIVNSQLLDLILNRFCFQLIENHDDFSNTVFIGLQPRGVTLANELIKKLIFFSKNKIQYGKLDITFYRDDFRRNDNILTPSQTNINFSIEDKNVVLIDDVLFTGRTIRSAMDALLDFGRPKKVELLILIDRRYSRHLPIKPNYLGLKVDTSVKEKVEVNWNKNQSHVMIISNK